MLDPDRPFFISPPFGTYLCHKKAYSVFGSYTRYPRPGWFMQVLRTVRPLGREEDGEPKGWVNKIGLRNIGWQAIGHPTWDPYKIASLALMVGDSDEWFALREFLHSAGGVYLRHIEINVSCPNTDHPLPALPDDTTMTALNERQSGATVWKLQPVAAALPAALRLADHGAQYIHLSNTLPSPIGGLSGKAQREVNLPLVGRVSDALARGGYKETHREFAMPVIDADGRAASLPPNRVEIIAGGGIYYPEHLLAYRNAGATRFSMATPWCNPARARRIMRVLENRREDGYPVTP